MRLVIQQTWNALISAPARPYYRASIIIASNYLTYEQENAKKFLYADSGFGDSNRIFGKESVGNWMEQILKFYKVIILDVEMIIARFSNIKEELLTILQWINFILVFIFF